MTEHEFTNEGTLKCSQCPAIFKVYSTESGTEFCPHCGGRANFTE